MDKQQAKATFRISSVEEDDHSKGDEGQRISRGSSKIAYGGELEGEGLLAELRNYTNDHTATVYGLERITGALAGRSGSFVLEHVGKLDQGVLDSVRTVVPGSGTGELKGLRGVAHVVSAGGDLFGLELRYYFDDEG